MDVCGPLQWTIYVGLGSMVLAKLKGGVGKEQGEKTFKRFWQGLWRRREIHRWVEGFSGTGEVLRVVSWFVLMVLQQTVLRSFSFGMKRDWGSACYDRERVDMV
jgi:hypothetical protein